jgi:hypothetical protein
MRVRLFAVTALAAFCAGEAIAAPFCVVSATGRQCYYYTLSECQRAARQVDGGCVANTEAPPSNSPAQSYSPTPAPQYPSAEVTRPYADVAGSFQRGVEASRQRQYEEERRALELERMRLENERLRQSSAPAAAPPKPSEGSDFWSIMSGSIVSDIIRREGMFPRPQPGWYDEQRLSDCEDLRFTANAAAARSGLFSDETTAAGNAWRECIGPNLHPELMRPN